MLVLESQIQEREAEQMELIEQLTALMNEYTNKYGNAYGVKYMRQDMKKLSAHPELRFQYTKAIANKS